MHPLLQRTDLAVGRLQLDVHHGPVADQGQGLGERRDASRPCPPAAARRGRRPCGRASRPCGAGHPLQVVVVEDHGLAVGGELDVELDAVAGGAGGLEGAPASSPAGRPGSTARGARSAGRTAAPRPRRSRVFTETCHHGVDLDREVQRQAIDARPPSGHGGRRRRTPRPSGRSSRSPPGGCRRSSGPAWTKPPSFTTRTTRSRSPSQAAFIWAIRLMPQSRAARLAVSRSTSSPTTPLDAARGVHRDLAGDVDAGRRRARTARSWRRAALGCGQRDAERRRGGLRCWTWLFFSRRRSPAEAAARQARESFRPQFCRPRPEKNCIAAPNHHWNSAPALWPCGLGLLSLV